MHLCWAVAPVEQHLPYDRTYFHIIPSSPRLDDHIEQLISIPPFNSSRCIISFNLPFIIATPPPGVKPAVPLKPSIWIRISHVSAALPHS